MYAPLCANLDAVNDFYLAVEAKLVRGDPTQISYGLMFRIAGINFDRYYFFQFREDKLYNLLFWDGSKYKDIIHWSSTNAVKLGKFNRLEIVAIGSVFYFYINGQDLGHTEDNNLKLGQVGLSVGSGASGEEAVVDFKNFELRRKPSDLPPKN